MDQKEIVENVLIDPNLESYEQFFDHGWCERMCGLVENSPLKAAIGALMVAWRSTNGVHRLPWLMVMSLQSFADGEYKGSFQFRANYSDKVIKGIVEKLDRRMRYTLKRDQLVVLNRVIAQIEKEAFQDLKGARDKLTIDVSAYWKSIITTSEFQFSLLGTQNMNYGTLFFAYEDFLAITIRTKEPAYSSKKIPIKVAFAKHFGDPLTDECWNHAEVELAKLVRHALAHNGARFGSDLEKFKTRFVDATGMRAPLLKDNLFNVVNGKIQIMPCNTTYLFGILKDRVTKIVEGLA
jgi:hypothetical protein